MSVKTAGADDLAEYAEMFRSGQSQHVPITRDRLMHDMLFREAPDSDPKRQYYGCFVRDSDAFDHKYFKRSPRESTAMDPQSRLVLEAAYQAVEQSGYYSELDHGHGLGQGTDSDSTNMNGKMHVGVYLGSCGVDYEHNISCHEPNAFTPTGALKSFVTGRKLSDAIRDGNPVLAVISSTVVYQNMNSTPLFVPHAPLLSRLFTDVLRSAKVVARDTSLVEAHGTGTPVRDPAEYESTHTALGGPASGRVKKLPIGSVKGHIGHTEGASGVLALIKVIMVMRGAFISPQASFNKMNHGIEMRTDSMIEVVNNLRPWKEDHKMALINNYGACGSNASLIVAQPPKSLRPSMAVEETSQYPFWIPGLDARAISACAAKLSSYCRSLPQESSTLADISYVLNRQSNRGLAQSFIFSCRSMAEFQEKLAQVASAPEKDSGLRAGVTPAKASRPVILCFGGQVSLFVGLDGKLYDSVTMLRLHLNECDRMITSLGLGSIYPDIFSQQPIRDPIKLQTVLFAMQYSCAKTWMDCGLETKVVAVVGHSFGEITALCVAGSLSLRDTVRLVAARAKLVRDSWGIDPGAMVAVEADLDLVESLLQEVNLSAGRNGSVNIACYNGPRSFTLAGSTATVDALQQTMVSSAKFSSTKNKRLSVTNAFHSALVEKVVAGLGRVGKGLTFHKPVIAVERATQESNELLDWTFVPQHMRQPVFFNHAVQRLAKRHPQAVFLEAGTNSTITVMAARALAQSNVATPEHYLQAVSITNIKGFDELTDATVALWKQGLRMAFWAHHQQQTLQYASLLLPPYQFVALDAFCGFLHPPLHSRPFHLTGPSTLTCYGLLMRLTLMLLYAL
ncbi:Type I Iterative PKS [Elasticomyces elasticus]|nr:Type I Iterative PKS [Elasticomyces elasticus]